MRWNGIAWSLAIKLVFTFSGEKKEWKILCYQAIVLIFHPDRIRMAHFMAKVIKNAPVRDSNVEEVNDKNYKQKQKYNIQKNIVIT